MSVDRDEILPGPTVEVQIDNSRSMYVTLNYQNGRPFEIFIRLDEPEMFEWVNTVTVLVSRLLRAGESLEDIAEDLTGIHSPRTQHMRGREMIPSLSARIGMELIKMKDAYLRVAA